MTTTSARAPASPPGSPPTPDGVERAGSMDGDDLRAVGRRDRHRHREPKGRLRDRRQRAAVRRGHRQRTEDLVAGSGSASGDLGRAGRSPGQGCRRDRRLGRSARDDPRRAARQAGAGAGRADRGCGDPALHVSGRRSAPPSPPADQRPRLGGRLRGAASTPSGSATASRPSTGSGTPPSRPTRSSGPPSQRTGSPSTRRPARSASSRRTWVRSAPGPRRSVATSTATKPTWRTRASRRGAGSATTRGVGPASVGTKPGPTRSSRQDGRELVDRWNAELRDLGYRDPTESRCPGWDAAGMDRPRCRGRAGRLHPRGEEVGVEHRRHPRKDRGPPRADLPDRRHSRADRARRGHHRPSGRPVRHAARPGRCARARPVAHARRRCSMSRPT